MKKLMLFMLLLLINGLEAVRFTKKGLETCLHQKGFDFLLQKTTFIKRLTMQEYGAEELIKEVDACYAEFEKYFKQESIMKALVQNKPQLYALILENEPKMLEAIQGNLNASVKPKEFCIFPTPPNTP